MSTHQNAFFGLLLALALFLHGVQGGLKTYCLANENDCDENWTPFPNMASALVGYDLPKGNPFATHSIEDPGLRKQIFNATFEDGEDYVLESGITAREYKMCDTEFTNRGATNMRGYEKAASVSSSAGFGFDIGIEAEEDGGRHEGQLPPVVSIAWQKTKEYEAVRQFIFKTRGAIVISEAQCITHKVDVSHFLTPGFHPAFIEVLRFLEKQNTTIRQERAFKRFIRDYGTHYVSSAYMGAKLASTVFYTNYERLKYGRQRLYNCSAENAFKVFKLGGSDDDEEDSSDDSDEDETDSNDPMNSMKMKRCPDIDNLDPERVLSTTFSGKPEEGDLSKWPEQEIKPIPIKFELTPIVNLFTKENLDERLNVSSSEILDWFLPLYLKYCLIFDLQCTVEKGCGFNDDCGFNENCILDRNVKKGYVCQKTSWADVANWPQLPIQTKPDDAEQRSVVGFEPDSPNISWFFDKDLDQSGSLSDSELWIRYTEHNWYNQRYQNAIEKLILEADTNFDRLIDMEEYIKLHETHPWFSEQITFMLMNTDNNDHLSRQELLEASKISPDMHNLGFNQKQLENLIDGLAKIGDKNKDDKITFEEYVSMSRDVFVDNFAPNVFKRIMKNR